MDIVFKCPNCKQELEVDAAATGQEITCPACSKTLSIPAADASNTKAENPVTTPVNPGREHRHLSVPVSDAPVATLIKKALAPLDSIAKDGVRELKIKTIRHGDCREVGHDNFDKVATDVLQKIGQDNIVSINTINYSFIEIGTSKMLTDFGILIVYKG